MHIYLDKIIVLQILFWWLFLQGRERYEVTDFIFQGASWTSRMDRSCQHVYRLQMDFLAKTAMPFSAHLYTPTYICTCNLLISISYKRNKCRKVYKLVLAIINVKKSNSKRTKTRIRTAITTAAKNSSHTRPHKSYTFSKPTKQTRGDRKHTEQSYSVREGENEGRSKERRVGRIKRKGGRRGRGGKGRMKEGNKGQGGG